MKRKVPLMSRLDQNFQPSYSDILSFVKSTVKPFTFTVLEILGPSALLPIRPIAIKTRAFYSSIALV